MIRRQRSDLRRQFQEVSFSLVDYRNNYFTSSEPEKILEFYNGFKNRDQLIQWMKERPKGASYIHEVEGDKEIIVVIPTADFNGKYARECRDNIFKGLHMVFVESGEIPDPYFNYSHNCNVGIKKAMEYNPKWIIVSNDDLYKIDDISVLKQKLLEIDESNKYFVFTQESTYHSVNCALSNPRMPFIFFYNVLRYFRHKLLGRDQLEKEKEGLRTRFGIFLKGTSDRNLLEQLFYKPLIRYKITEDFGIFSSIFIREQQNDLFDETFINGSEDDELCIRISKFPEKMASIDYKIGDYISSSLGRNSKLRWLQDIVNSIYLNYLFKDLQES